MLPDAEPGEVAAHLVAAGPTDPAAVAAAVGWCERAAAAASTRLGHAEAAAHLAAALTLPGGEAGEGRRLLGALAEAQDRAGETAAARASFRRLAGDAAAAGDSAELLRAALGVHRLGSRTAAEFAESLGLLAEAEAALPAGADRERCTLLAARASDLVHASWNSGPDPTAADVAGRALELARRVGDPALLATALLAAHNARWRPGTAAERLPIADEMADAAAGDPELLAQALLLRATALLELGDPAAPAELRAYAEASARLGHARGRHAALTRSATAELLAGDLDAAAGLAGEGLTLGLAMGAPEAMPVFLTLRTALALAGGPPPPDGPPGIPPDDPVWALRPVWQAAAAAGAGRVADARAALAGWRMSALPELHDLEWVVVAAVGITAAGTERQRADCYARLAPYAGTHVVVGGCAAYYGPVDHHLGLLADALGRTADAAAHRRAALAASDRLGTPAWTATTRPPWTVLRAGRPRSAATARPGRSATPAARCTSPTPRDCTTWRRCWRTPVPRSRRTGCGAARPSRRAPTRCWTSRPGRRTGGGWRSWTTCSTRPTPAVTRPRRTGPGRSGRRCWPSWPPRPAWAAAGAASATRTSAPARPSRPGSGTCCGASAPSTPSWPTTWTPRSPPAQPAATRRPSRSAGD